MLNNVCKKQGCGSGSAWIRIQLLSWIKIPIHEGEKGRKNALQFLKIVILLSLKKQIKLKMGAEAQLSVLRNLFTI